MSTSTDAELPERGNSAFAWRYPYVAVYRVQEVTGPVPAEHDLANGVRLALQKGPLQFHTATATQHRTDNYAVFTPGLEVIDLPDDYYLVLITEVDANDGPHGAANARLAIAEVLGLLALHFQGWLMDPAFQGAVSVPGSAVTFAPEGPLRIMARRSPAADAIIPWVADEIATLVAMPPDDRDRSRLMSRWIMRAEDTLNEVDQFLFLFVALEVFPAVGSTDVPRAIQDLLQKRAFPGVDRGVLKERLLLGRICGTRADIVHKGKSAIDPGERDAFTSQLNSLRAIAKECLSLLQGKPYSGSLDGWIVGSSG